MSRARLFAGATTVVMAAVGVSLVIAVREPAGAYLELDPFTPRDLRVTVARRQGTDSVVFGGMGVRLRGKKPVFLETVSIGQMDPGVSLVRAEVLVVRENRGGFFNGTCGSLPFDEAKGEWSSHPVHGFRLEADTTVVFAIQAETSIPTGEIGISELIVTYRLEGVSTSLQQSFPYRAVFGKQLGIECEPEDREGPLSFGRRQA